MKKPLPDKKSVRNDARLFLEKGHTKQEAYELLIEKYPFTIMVAEEVRWLPTLKAKKKYQLWNYLLISLMLVWAGLSLWQGQKWFSLFPHFGFAYIATLMLLKYYYCFLFYPFLGLGAIISIFIDDPTIIKSDWMEVTAIIFLFAAPCILAFWLTSKLCPKPLESKDEYINSSGERRLKFRYSFKN